MDKFNTDNGCSNFDCFLHIWKGTEEICSLVDKTVFRCYCSVKIVTLKCKWLVSVDVVKSSWDYKLSQAGATWKRM